MLLRVLIGILVVIAAEGCSLSGRSLSDPEGKPDGGHVGIQDAGDGHRPDASAASGSDGAAADGGDIDAGPNSSVASRKIVEQDYRCDGTSRTCTTYSYDAQGGQLAEVRDDGCDGSPDWTAPCRLYAYDPGGNTTSEATDDDCDGTADADCVSYVYDDPGEKVSTVSDRDCDGTPNECADPSCRCEISTRDDLGRTTGSAWDLDCDGASDKHCETAAYNDSKKTSRHTLDDDCDGVPEACWKATYGGDGNVATFAKDADCDGTTDSECFTYTYDAHGRATGHTEDAKCDGDICTYGPDYFTPVGDSVGKCPSPWDNCDCGDCGSQFVSDVISRHTASASCSESDGSYVVTEALDDQGRLAVFADYSSDPVCKLFDYYANGLPKTVSVDDACDGTVEHCKTSTYYADGSLKTEAVDDDCDGSSDHGCTTYEYGPSGAKKRVTVDELCDGHPSTRVCERATYDDAGRVLTRESYEGDCAGIRNCEASMYDAHGYLAHYSQDDRCDGTDDFCVSYERDEAGRITSLSGDYHCDGADWYERHTYDAEGRVTSDVQEDIGRQPSCIYYRYE